MPVEHEKIKRTEFIAFWLKKEREDNGWRAWAFIALYVGSMLVFMPVIPLLDRHPERAWLWFVLFFAWLILSPFLWSRLVHKKVDRTFFKCPVCMRSTVGSNHLIIVATGKCGYCGEEILE
jgi:ribosomal protein S27AE